MLWLSGELQIELVQFLEIIIKVVKHLLRVFQLYIAYLLHLILYNFLDSSSMNNLLEFLNVFLILVHVLRLASPFEQFKEYSINYVVLSYILRNLQSIGIGDNSCYNLVIFDLFASQGLAIPSLCLKVLFVNQNQIVDIKQSGLFDMEGALFIVHSLKDIMDIVIYCSHSIKQLY